jgi:hypothetical protein
MRHAAHPLPALTRAALLTVTGYAAAWLLASTVLPAAPAAHRTVPQPAPAPAIHAVQESHR